jgi:hypothetical protein
MAWPRQPPSAAPRKRATHQILHAKDLGVDIDNFTYRRRAEPVISHPVGAPAHVFFNGSALEVRKQQFQPGHGLYTGQDAREALHDRRRVLGRH